MDKATLLYFLCRALVVYGFLFAIFDPISTFLAIRNGAHEANWGWAWVMRVIGPKWVIPRVLFGLGVVYLNVTYGNFSWVTAGTLSVSSAFLTWVVVHNLRLAGWWK